MWWPRTSSRLRIGPSGAPGWAASPRALSKGEYEAGLAAAGFEQVSVAFTHPVGDGLHSAVIKATKPTDADSTAATAWVGRTTLPMASDSACC